MMSLLLLILVLGVIAWAIRAVSVPEPFATFALAVLIIVVLVAVFRFLGVSLPSLG
jgi:hypothetical protein